MVQLPKEEYPDFYVHYLGLTGPDILSELKKQLDSYPDFALNIPEEKELYSYGPGKWTVKEVLGHITDTERVVYYRAFCVARNDKSPLPYFDEDSYVLATDFNSRSLEDLVEEFKIVRQNTIALVQRLDEESLRRIGTASGKNVSTRALLYFMIGHLQHHINILNERYLI